MPNAPINMNVVDLNLVRVFDAVMEERSVVRASRRLGITQSAVSHALNRLRHLLKDDLFLRGRDGMVPTARALEVSHPLHQALAEIAASLAVQRFEPATARHRFVLAANDVLTAVLVPQLVALLAATAPGVDLVVRPATRIDLAEQMDMGLIDVALGAFSEIPARFGAGTVLRHGEVALMRRGHPAACGPFAVTDMARFPLAAVSLGGAEAGAVGGYILERGLGRRSDMFDRAALESTFTASGLPPPRLALLVPHFLALPMLIAQTDYIAIVPDIAAPLFTGAGPLRSRPLPYNTALTTVQSVWHRRRERDLAHDWFRGTLSRLGVEPGASSQALPDACVAVDSSRVNDRGH